MYQISQNKETYPESIYSVSQVGRVTFNFPALSVDGIGSNKELVLSEYQTNRLLSFDFHTFVRPIRRWQLLHNYSCFIFTSFLSDSSQVLLCPLLSCKVFSWPYILPFRSSLLYQHQSKIFKTAILFLIFNTSLIINFSELLNIFYCFRNIQKRLIILCA